jgi:hypothetical protein
LVETLAKYETDDMLDIDQSIINILNIELENNPSPIWKEQITKTLAVLNN